eukprot:Rmarinus@m.27405
MGDPNQGTEGGATAPNADADSLEPSSLDLGTRDNDLHSTETNDSVGVGPNVPTQEGSSAVHITHASVTVIEASEPHHNPESVDQSLVVADVLAPQNHESSSVTTTATEPGPEKFSTLQQRPSMPTVTVTSNPTIRIVRGPVCRPARSAPMPECPSPPRSHTPSPPRSREINNPPLSPSSSDVILTPTQDCDIPSVDNLKLDPTVEDHHVPTTRMGTVIPPAPSRADIPPPAAPSNTSVLPSGGERDKSAVQVHSGLKIPPAPRRATMQPPPAEALASSSPPSSASTLVDTTTPSTSEHSTATKKIPPAPIRSSVQSPPSSSATTSVAATADATATALPASGGLKIPPAPRRSSVQPPPSHSTTSTTSTPASSASGLKIPPAPRRSSVQPPPTAPVGSTDPAATNKAQAHNTAGGSKLPTAPRRDSIKPPSPSQSAKGTESPVGGPSASDGGTEGGSPLQGGQVSATAPGAQSESDAGTAKAVRKKTLPPPKYATMPSRLNDEQGGPSREASAPKSIPRAPARATLPAAPAAELFASKAKSGKNLSSPHLKDTKQKVKALKKGVYADYLDKGLQIYLSGDGFADFVKMDFVYLAGPDVFGRPVVVFSLGNVPADVDLEKVVLYIIVMMDSIVNNDYSIVVLHCATMAEPPEFSWLRHIYNLFDRRYKKNLKTMYVLHPGFFFKSLLSYFKPIMSKKFWNQILTLDSILDLLRYVPASKLRLPQHVVSHDRRLTKDTENYAVHEEGLYRSPQQDGSKSLVCQHAVEGPLHSLSAPPTVSALMQVRKDHLLRSKWSTRWYAIRGDSLYIYKLTVKGTKEEQEKAPRVFNKVLPLPHALMEPLPEATAGRPNCIHLTTPERQKPMILSPADLLQREQWLDELEAAAYPNSVFGVPLDVVMERESGIPAVILSAVRFVDDKGLELEGLYRVSGGQDDVRSLRSAFNREGPLEGVRKLRASSDVHVVTGLLKMYLRMLAVPLLTYDAYQDFVQASEIADEGERTVAIRLVLTSLPRTHRTTLSFLFAHFARVCAKEEVNLMSAENLAKVIAPNILRPKRGTVRDDVLDSRARNTVVKSLIKDSENVLELLSEVAYFDEQWDSTWSS